MWVRGLKLGLAGSIEYHGVAPYVGAWIETFATNILTEFCSRTLCGCVD